MSATVRFYRLTLGWACLGLLIGCSQLDLSKRIPWSTSEEDQPQTAQRVVPMWTDAVLQRPNRPATRGFGGRLMFYGPEGKKPVKVEGKLVIYAFDEEGRDPGNTKPDRKYVFTKEQLAKRYSKTEIGHSYSVWLPWGEMGGLQKEISLIARFTSDDGTTTVSEQTRQLLPGKLSFADNRGPRPAKGGPTAGAIGQQVRPVSYEADADREEAEEAGRKKPRMKTTTINVPPRAGGMPTVATVRRPATTSRANTTPQGPEADGLHDLERRATQTPDSWGSTSQRQPASSSRRATLSRRARSSRSISRARAEPSARPVLGRASWQQRPAVSSSYPEPVPPSASESEYVGNAPAGR